MDDKKMKKYIGGTPEAEAFLEHVSKRQIKMDTDQQAVVKKILDQVRENGDLALRSLTQRFDGVRLENFEVSEEAFQLAQNRVPESLKEIMKKSFDQIYRFHEMQKPKGYEVTCKGSRSGVRYIPMEKAGIYVPGGLANYPSSVLMNAVPAIVAGVEEIVMVTPPNKDGAVSDEVLVAAQICGIKSIYKIGGAQAIAALAYGTQTVPKVDVITGPGNVYVSIAKKMVFGEVNIDMIAGPSEITIISDGNQNPEWLAADLLSQAEHDTMASSILITRSAEEANQVIEAVEVQLRDLPKKEIAEEALRNYGGVLICQSNEEMIMLSNRIAPEHLELMCSEIDFRDLSHAGCVFLGPYTPEPMGDYWAGPNHVLPTNGSARSFSPLGVDHFMKRSNYTQLDFETLELMTADLAKFARAEGLEAHARAMERRLK